MRSRYQELYDNFSIPEDHVNYLQLIRDTQAVNPRVIYDIGACTLHWYRAAREIWPDAEIYVFDVLPEFAEFYQQQGVKYHIDCLGAENAQVKFYSNAYHPAGNSYYQENSQINPQGKDLYRPQIKFTKTLDSVIRQHRWPRPDLIKLDVQGAELDILSNAPLCMESTKDIILELQNQEYNLGAPLAETVNQWLTSQGFGKQCSRFSGTDIQGDYHYTRN